MHNPQLAGESKNYRYYVYSEGFVMKVNKITKAETRVIPRIDRYHAFVSINATPHALRNLVARHFHPNYYFGCLVETIDGDPTNCCVGNLRVYSKKEQNRKPGNIGHQNGLLRNRNRRGVNR